MLINFNDLLFLSNKVNGIIHIGAHKLEDLPDYLKGNVRRVIWVEANPEKYYFIEERLKRYKNMTLGKFAASLYVHSGQRKRYLKSLNQKKSRCFVLSATWTFKFCNYSKIK